MNGLEHDKPFCADGGARHDEAIAKVRGTPKFSTTFNRTDDAERAYDIYFAIAYCRTRGLQRKASGVVNIVAFGKASPWTAVSTAMLAPAKHGERERRCAIDGNQFPANGEDACLEELFIPRILRAGGLPNILALSLPHPIFSHNTGDTLARPLFAMVAEPIGDLSRLTVAKDRQNVARMLEFMIRAVHLAPVADPPG